MISALGAINGMILTGSRVNASLGRDHRLFRRLGRWDEGRGAPLGALVAQAGITVLLVLAIGTARGRGMIDAVFDAFRLTRIPWDDYFGGFETLVAATSPVFWSFFILTGVSVFVLRARNPERPRPFSIPGYPLPPLIFCAMCAYMLYSSLVYAGMLAGLAVVVIAAGVPLFLLGRR